MENVVSDQEQLDLRSLHKLSIEKMYMCDSDQMHSRLLSPEIQNVLTLPIVHPETEEPLYNVKDCLKHLLEEEYVERRCHLPTCISTRSVQYSFVDVQPQVSVEL